MHDDTIRSGKQLAEYATDLLDSEVQQAVQIIASVQNKYKHRNNSVENLEMLRDEALTRLSEIGILATLDPAPCFYGEPPILEIIGKVGGVRPLDHEQKGYEVKKATKRGEEYLGQKERPNSRKKK